MAWLRHRSGDDTRSPLARKGPASWTDGTVLGFVFLLAVLPYANTLLNGFVYDDQFQILQNPYVYSFRHLKAVLSTTAWSFLGQQGVTNYYRPMMTVGYMVCFKLFGLLPYGYHLANLLFHTGVVFLVFAAARRMTRNRSMAFAAAAAFALHPIHTESVAWIAGVTDLEMTLFSLAAFWFFLRLDDAPGRRYALMQAGMAVSFVLALLSKEQAITLVILIPLFEHFVRGDRKQTSWQRKARRYTPIWALAGAYLAFRMWHLGGVAPVLQRPNVSWTQTFFSAMALVGEYIWKSLWPAHQNAFYVFHASSRITELAVIAGLAAILGCVSLFAMLWKRSRVATFGLAWFFITLAPVLNVHWMAANAFAERYLYLPTVGLGWLLGWTLIEGWQALSSHARVWRYALAFAVCTIGFFGSYRIITRNAVWHDEMTLYTSTLAAEPDAAYIRINLGKLYWDMGKIQDAEREWLIALEDRPDSAVCLNDLGQLRRTQKRFPEAIQFYRKAIELRPNYADPHLNLGKTYAEMGRTDAAEQELRKAVEISPLNPETRNGLGNYYLGSGRYREAETEFRHSMESLPTGEALDGLGEIHLRFGGSAKAELAFRQALRLNSFDSRAHFGLGALYASQGHIQGALREYEAGLEINPANGEARAAVEKLRTLQEPAAVSKSP